ncbi:MAG: hypothetical protein JWM55_1665 [Acidimicrobiaceae bacterium]|nr:hypothetical protein [Acidimicrobiaceae bacterium]
MIATLTKTENSVQLVAIIAFAVVASSLVRKGRADPQAAYLLPRQRVRPLALEVIDPLMTIIVVGPVLAHELNVSAWHILAGLLGVTVGVPIGILRSRVQFVRAVRVSTSVVLTRSNAEYGLLALLIVLRSAEDGIRNVHTTSITLLFAALLALPVGESFARSIAIVGRYRNSVNEAPPMGLSP